MVKVAVYIGRQIEGHKSKDWLACYPICVERYWYLLRNIVLALRLLKCQNSPHQFSSVTQLCLTLCNPMDCCTAGLPVHHQLPEFTQTHLHWVSDGLQSYHPVSSPSPPAFNLRAFYKNINKNFEVNNLTIYLFQKYSLRSNVFLALTIQRNKLKNGLQT